jgi:16S rRNA (adenine1518-N6/adenine1519-N6)-dimethyltransferase
MQRLGISPRKSFSQNFLCLPSLARRIAEMADWPEATPVLEVGGGTGVLTRAIADRYPDLVVVELDRGLAEHLRQTSGVRIHEGDARDVDLEAEAEARGRLGVFGNLPYGITTELLMWLVRARRSLVGAVIMVQKEYAERLVAKPRTKAYGSLSVFAAFHIEVVERLTVSPGSFYPPPLVSSQVLAMRFREPPDGVPFEWLERVGRAGFAHRRKLLRSNLVGALSLDAPRVESALSDAGVATTVRAEELEPDVWRRVAERLEPDAGR